MTDIFEEAPAPTDDELEAFDAIARDVGPRAFSHPEFNFHNQARLMVPRLVKEIRRLRALVQLESEREQLRTERAQRAEPKGTFEGYDDAAKRLADAVRKGGSGDVH